MLDKMTFKQYRLALEIKKSELGKMLGVHENTINNWEKDPARIPIGYAIKMCEIFGVSMDSVIFLPNMSTNM